MDEMVEMTINTPAGKIRVGSVVEVSSWIGGPVTLTVSHVDEDIKNGRAGMDLGPGRWAYADQTLRVVKF